MANKQKYDRRVMCLLDGYVHGQVSSRQMLYVTAQITAYPTTAVQSINAPLMLHHCELEERVNAAWPDVE